MYLEKMDCTVLPLYCSFDWLFVFVAAENRSKKKTVNVPRATS